MDIHTEIQNAVRSKWLAWLLLGLGALLVLLLVFDAGLAVGTRRAMELRGGPRVDGHSAPMFGIGGFGVTMPHGFIPDGHGAVGTIQSINLPTITIKTRDGDTEEVVLSDSTTIESATTSMNATNLAVGQQIVAVGNPNAATSSQRMTAELIRVLPPLR